MESDGRSVFHVIDVELYEGVTCTLPETIAGPFCVVNVYPASELSSNRQFPVASHDSTAYLYVVFLMRLDNATVCVASVLVAVFMYPGLPTFETYRSLSASPSFTFVVKSACVAKYIAAFVEPDAASFATKLILADVAFTVPLTGATFVTTGAVASFPPPPSPRFTAPSGFAVVDAFERIDVLPFAAVTPSR